MITCFFANKEQGYGMEVKILPIQPPPPYPIYFSEQKGVTLLYQFDIFHLAIGPEVIRWPNIRVGNCWELNFLAELTNFVFYFFVLKTGILSKYLLIYWFTYFMKTSTHFVKKLNIQIIIWNQTCSVLPLQSYKLLDKINYTHSYSLHHTV